MPSGREEKTLKADRNDNQEREKRAYAYEGEGWKE